MELDRQSIERTDFPIGRRGYDAAAVDAHLHSIAVAVEQLERAAIAGPGQSSLASAAGVQVQGILEAAEQTAADIERRAQESARELRAAAARDAERTREEAIEKARAHVAGVAHVTATLLERVGAMDGEVRALVDSLRAGAGRMAGDLAAVESNMTELYDAASGEARAPDSQPAAEFPPPSAAYEATYAEEPQPQPVYADPEQGTFAAELAGAMSPVPAASAADQMQSHAAQEPAEQGAGDVDGARLVALNMALNGESRADTERYLAENFQLADRTKLVDEVYAAIEG